MSSIPVTGLIRANNDSSGRRQRRLTFDLCTTICLLTLYIHPSHLYIASWSHSALERTLST